MKTRSFLFILLAAFALQSCNKPSSSQGEETASGSDEELKTVVNGYIKIKDALVNDNSATAKQEALALADLTTGKYEAELDEYIQAIGQFEDLEEQRYAFDAFSKALYDVVKNEKPGQTLYKQYCPMAFDDKGAFWLSDKKEIYNPYFGASMLRCGAVEEVIN